MIPAMSNIPCRESIELAEFQINKLCSGCEEEGIRKGKRLNPIELTVPIVQNEEAAKQDSRFFSER